MARRLVSTLTLTVLTVLAGCSNDDGSGSGDLDDSSEYNMHCDAQADWDPAWAQYETEVLAIVNARRAEGAICGGDSFAPAGPLVAEAQLRCAARLHSQDMFDRMFFAHDNLDGQSPWDRVDETDYDGSATGENIARGQVDPTEVMASWMDSPPHCGNIMNPNHTEIGIGYYGDGHYWTQVMGQR